MSREYLPGQIIAYPYLWAWQQDRGETEGRKNRPTCVIVAVRDVNDELTHLALLAITTQPPQGGRMALDIPEIERQRAGLGDLKRCWIVVDEYNYDIAERSWYIEPGSHVLGRFSKAFVMKVATAFAQARQSGRRISRLD
ncbi:MULTISPECIES: hypothetical protein [Phyllobacteriaceae]|uniref:hypothetical protein n=1 Tax=Phyllobacteriaceae TaxID=69277 RepID=UPI0020964C87|nr:MULTISPECIES: hypothetical protein [Phyllobacteriaceae]MCO6392343.1 hypothetical protein [Aliihoeflea aestuarii]MCR5860346.1 hypothetical protein [Mesorhizobium sp. J428]